MAWDGYVLLAIAGTLVSDSTKISPLLSLDYACMYSDAQQTSLALGPIPSSPTTDTSLKAIYNNGYLVFQQTKIDHMPDNQITQISPSVKDLFQVKFIWKLFLQRDCVNYALISLLSICNWWCCFSANPVRPTFQTKYRNRSLVKQ